ncbi:AlpA family phage regulatory protein [Aliarcobacter butzleri]|uniref:AlpA family phage regulatory protein n=1 Tax=Aliarcobacter butzleri TaxID=28197 RepID=UPI003AFB7DA1
MSPNIKPARMSMDLVSSYIGICRNEIYKKLNPKDEKYDEEFPKPLKYGNKNLFITTEIDTWLDIENKKLKENMK